MPCMAMAAHICSSKRVLDLYLGSWPCLQTSMQVMASIPLQMAPALRDSCMTTVSTAGVRCHTQMVTGEQASWIFLPAAHVHVCITLRPHTAQSSIKIQASSGNLLTNVIAGTRGSGGVVCVAGMESAATATAIITRSVQHTSAGRVSRRP